LNGTHADENADGSSLRGSYKSYQGYHNTDDIDGLGIVRDQGTFSARKRKGREQASNKDKEF
jgi:hypothetical protein